MKRRQLLLTGGVAAAAVAGGAAWRWRAERASQPGDGPEGADLPAFWQHSVEGMDGQPLPLRSLLGQPLLVNFWATWCPPCIREMPIIDRFHREFGAARGNQAWRVLGLAIDRREPVADFLARQPVGYLIAMAGLEGTEWSRALGNERGGLPFSVAFDARGRIRHRKLGEISEAELRAWASA
jgi:thiol-disulfide isomerase/thioredoxin